VRAASRHQDRGGAMAAVKVEKRARWLNANVFADRPIDDEAIAAMVGMGTPRAMELFKEMEEKGVEIKKPSMYLKSAARREGFGPPAAPSEGKGRGGRKGGGDAGGKGKGKGGGNQLDKVSKRAQWLNDNVFPDRPIDDEAIAAMIGMGQKTAMELFKELETQSSAIRNPSGYLKSQARKAGFGPSEDYSAPSGRKAGGGGNRDFGKVEKRATWLNANVFGDRPIDEEAMAALAGMGVGRAMELFKEVEEKAGQVKNPSGYLKAAAAREGFAPPDKQGGGKGGGKAAARNTHTQYERDYDKVEKRAAWLNKNVFASSPIDDEAVAAMAGMGAARAMELFKEIEEKGGQVRNPSGYLKSAARKEGFGPAAEPPSTSPRQGGAAKGGGGKGGKMSNSNLEKMVKRVLWLNDKVFLENPIEEETVLAMESLSTQRAMELFKETEEKAAEIRNPNGYLKAAVKREGKGQGKKRKELEGAIVPVVKQPRKGKGKGK